MSIGIGARGALTVGLALFSLAAAAGPRFPGRTRVVSRGSVITPPSNDAPAGFARTNLEIFEQAGGWAPGSGPSGPYETPASLACVYGLTRGGAGCNPETLTQVATGGSRVIAIVDAYDDPNAANDLATFSATFGLPPISADNFQVVTELGQTPPTDPSGLWELEESLDIEMAHALAPDAKIVLVEAQSNSTWDLAIAEGVAAGIIRKAGGGEVSNSWDSAEFSGEEGWAGSFRVPHAVVFFASGDTPGPSFPSALGNVVAVGGTTIERDGQGNYLGQIPWAFTGGGLSQYVPRPGFQNGVANVVGSQRGTPDVAFDADPASGVWIYDTFPLNGSPPVWTVLGGTSAATPALAAIVNNAGSFAAKTRDELALIYQEGETGDGWTDIATGSCGNGQALAGFDLCTGVGVPAGRAGK